MSLTDEDRNWIATELAKLSANIERVEASLNRAGPLELPVKLHSLALRALDLESEALTDRVTKLEPPLAAARKPGRPDQRPGPKHTLSRG
jgi:hypothetical protein